MTSATDSGLSRGDEKQLLEEFRTDALLQGNTEDTLETYVSNLETFQDWLDIQVRNVGQDELKEFLVHLKQERTARDGSLGLTESTISGYFSALNTFYQFLAYEGYVSENPVPAFRDRYLDNGRNKSNQTRQLISVEEMSTLVHATLDVRNRAIILVFAKTGIRRGELIQIDLSDIDWDEQSIRLKPKAKRSNTLVFFDSECAQALKRWIEARNTEEPDTDALFTNQQGDRLLKNGVFNAVTKHAESVGLHDPDADDLQQRFTPHCCRHWFTTHLRRSGMKREFIKELRGDTRGDAVDIYDHIDRTELRQAYLAHIPTLGL